MVRWSEIDTVLLDMDGTLLDLHYDNTLWGTRLPQAYAERHGVEVEAARERLYGHMDETRSSLDYYCVDYWTTYTGTDIHGLHHELAHLIRYRSNAEAFIATLRGGGRRAVLVTNAHPTSLAVKDEHARLTERLDAGFSSHHFGAPKEHQEFWAALRVHEPFDPARTLMIDDNVAVLRAAADHGIAHLLCVSHPDSSRPGRTDLPFPAFDDFIEIMPP